MSRTYRKSVATNRRKAFDDENYGRDGGWNGRYSREMEDREQRSKRLKKVDKRSLLLNSLED